MASIGIDRFKELMIQVKNDILENIFDFIKNLKDRINSICANETKIFEKLSEIESDRRRKNLIIKGLNETEKNQKELEESVLAFINSKVQVPIETRDIDVVFRVGKKQNYSNKKRHIIIKLTSERKKNEIMRNKIKLKGTDIYIDNDYPKEMLNKIYENRQQKRSQDKFENSTENTDREKSPKRHTSPTTIISTPMPQD
jgi:hypothetical protein